MNGKKVVVALLFILTIIIGLTAIYFASTLKPKQQITPTPTPPLIVIKTPKPTEADFSLTPIVTDAPNTTPRPTNNPNLTRTPNTTPSITTDIGKLTCGQPCDKGACGEGYNCITINGTKKCVSNSCVTLQNGNYIPNGSCESDLCTIANEIVILKSSTISCINGQDNRKIAFNIKITNPVGITSARTSVKVTDDLNVNLLDSFIDPKSITNNGQLTTGQIKWTDLTLDANGGAIELHYEAIVPSTENGKSYSNVVSVFEGEVLKSKFNYEYTVNILPCTALITDEVDRILLGVILLIFGIFIYKMNWHYTIGQYFWEKGGKEIYSKSDFTVKSVNRFSRFIGKIFHNTYLDITQESNTKFERKLIQEEKRQLSINKNNRNEEK